VRIEVVWSWDEVHVDRTKESLSLDVRIFAVEMIWRLIAIDKTY
jgi:hypothetical protein